MDLEVLTHIAQSVETIKWLLIVAFFLAIVFGKIAEATHNFEYPLFAVAGVLAIGFLLWLLIDPLQQIAIPADNK